MYLTRLKNWPYEDADGTMRLGRMATLECITGTGDDPFLRFGSILQATAIESLIARVANPNA